MAIMKVPVVKAKTTLDVDTNALPEDVYAEALLLGLKQLLGRGMSKITSASTKDDAELQALALEQANKNLEKVKAGDIKFTGKKAAGKTKGEVMTEARRLAKLLVKDAIKRAKQRISDYDAKEISALAEEYIEGNSEILDQAKANIEARSKLKGADTIDVSKLVKNPKKVAKADEKKAEAKDKTLSAKQAGMVKVKAKGGKPAQQTAH